MNEETKKLIEKENWRKAKGIKYHKGEMFNTALAERDYSVGCKPSHLIEEIKGYHIWWCTPHHQPRDWCERERNLLTIQKKIAKTCKELLALVIFHE